MRTWILRTALVWMALGASIATAAPLCQDILGQAKTETSALKSSKITAQALSKTATEKIAVIPEFAYIREQAELRGLRVWLFGGTASSYLHYVKWDLARQSGQMNLQQDRFDYDFTNIFRSTQDLDIVVDATADTAKEFQDVIAAKFPHFLGAKAAKWEVRTLRTRIGSPGDMNFKEALLGDPDFINQNTDSNSLGMVEVTRSKEPVIRDLRHWDQAKSIFLEDTLNNRISFLRSDKHFTSARARAGENPEIMSVIRALVKAFQYELTFSEGDFNQMKSIVDAFDPRAVNNANALRRVQDTAKKLIMHAVNIEYAMNKLDELGLRQKLIAVGDKTKADTAAWWLNKEPLRSHPVGEGPGETAAQLGLSVVAHETNSFLAYESITRSHSGEPNVLISRQHTTGEAAIHGDGFYTRIGEKGARNTGMTIRFTVDPRARQGSDSTKAGDFIIFKNKKALKVIQESLNLSVEDLMEMAESGAYLKVDKSDLALLEKLKRKLNVTKIMSELEKLVDSSQAADHARLVQILQTLQVTEIKKLISDETLNGIAKSILVKLTPLKNSPDETQRLRYFNTVGSLIENLNSQGLLSEATFYKDFVNAAASPGASLQFRKSFANEALLKNLVGSRPENFEKFLNPQELAQFQREVREWKTSKSPIKRNYFEEAEKKLEKALINDDLQLLTGLIDMGLFDINKLNMSGHSLLKIAAFHNSKNIVLWLAQHEDFDIKRKDPKGYNEIEQLRLMDRGDLADEVEKTRQDVRVRKLYVRERREDGSPIIGFIRIDPKPFMMGTKFMSQQRPVTLKNSFEIMSVKTTQQVWEDVVLLLRKIGILGKLKTVPSGNRGPQLPVENVSYIEMKEWFAGLNELSKFKNDEVQEKLRSLFPGHRFGDHYRNLNTAEQEFILRSQGLVDTDDSPFGSGKDGSLADFAWYSSNSLGRTHPVGEKKPLWINGRPLYDIVGNVWEMVDGLDSGPISMRGACFGNTPGDLTITKVYGFDEKSGAPYAGFRVARDVRDK